MAEKKGEQKIYKMRTMAGDLDAQKRGARPTNISVSKKELESSIPPANNEELSLKDSLGKKEFFKKPPSTPLPEKNLRPPAPPGSMGIGDKLFSPQQPFAKKNPAPQVATPPLQELGNKPPLKKPEPPKNEGGGRRKLIALVSIAVLIVLIIGFEIWWFFIRPDGEEGVPTQVVEDILPPPEATLPTQPEQEEIDESVPENPVATKYLSYDREEVVVSDSSQSGDMSSAISQAINKGYPAGSLVLLNVLVEESGTRRFASLNELVGALNVTVDPSVRSMLTGNYNLMVFTPTTFDKSTCARAGRADPACSGPRLGLALKQKGGINIEATVSSWEASMPQDLQAMVLAQSTIGPGEFLLNDATYRDIPIRYRNFPIDTITIDYAVVNDLLLITTSKSSMFAAIDALP